LLLPFCSGHATRSPRLPNQPTRTAKVIAIDGPFLEDHLLEDHPLERWHVTVQVSIPGIGTGHLACEVSSFDRKGFVKGQVREVSVTGRETFTFTFAIPPERAVRRAEVECDRLHGL
jgi:hypothetical protein